MRRIQDPQLAALRPDEKLGDLLSYRLLETLGRIETTLGNMQGEHPQQLPTSEFKDTPSSLPITVDVTRDADGQINELFIRSGQKSMVVEVERDAHGRLSGMVIEQANNRRLEGKIRKTKEDR